MWNFGWGRSGGRRTHAACDLYRFKGEDVLAVAPELNGLTKVAVRLHPRYSEEPAADRSKLGGHFLWPAAEPWPVCDEHGIPHVPVLQLRSEDAPPHARAK